MSSLFNGFLVCGALAFAAALPAEVSETHLVLQRATRVPGAKLKSGSYTVRILDRLPDRYILEIVNDANPKSATTVLAIPDEHLPHTPDGSPTYWGNGAKVPSVRGMWIPGATSGAEFVFPKAEAAALAKQVRQPVPAIDPDSEGKKAVASMSEPDRQIVTLWLLSAVAVTPEGKQTEIKAAKFVPEPSAPMTTPQVASESTGSASIPGVSDAPSKPATTLMAKAGTPRNRLRTPAPTASQKPAGAAATDQPAKMPKTAGTFSLNLIIGLLLTLAGILVLIARKYQSAE